MTPAHDLHVFDLDGTLVDTLPDIGRALNAALTDAGRPVRTLPQIRGYLGEGARDLVRRACDAATEAELDVLVEAYRARYRQALVADTRLYPGVAEALAGGQRAAVLTNKPGLEARGILEALGLGGRFLEVVGDGDGYPRKPDPSALRAIIARAGAARPLYIGDSHVDEEVARNAGVEFVYVRYGYGSASPGARGVDRFVEIFG